MKENCQLTELRAQNPERYKPASEEERREQNYRLNRNWGMYFGVTFVLLLIIGAFAIGNRICPMNFGLDGGVCNFCEDEDCISCESDFKVCTQCQIGFFADNHGKCEACDADGKCDRCDSSG